MSLSVEERAEVRWELVEAIRAFPAAWTRGLSIVEDDELLPELGDGSAERMGWYLFMLARYAGLEVSRLEIGEGDVAEAGGLDWSDETARAGAVLGVRRFDSGILRVVFDDSRVADSTDALGYAAAFISRGVLANRDEEIDASEDIVSVVLGQGVLVTNATERVRAHGVGLTTVTEQSMAGVSGVEVLSYLLALRAASRPDEAATISRGLVGNARARFKHYQLLL